MSDDVATDQSEFWDRRRDLTVSPTTEEDVRQRAIGRARHLVLLAHITDQTVLSCFERILERLDTFDCFTSAPTRDLHITAKVFGNVVDTPKEKNEFSTEDEQQLAESLDATLGSATPFAVNFPRLNLFPTVVYAEVDDDDQFGTLNRRVCNIDNVPVWGRDRDGFIPHLSLGHFIQQDGYKQLLQYLGDNRSLDIPSTAIEELKFVALDLSKGRFPPYETIETYSLSQQ